MSRKLKIISAASFCILLAACGGGGGGDDDAVSQNNSGTENTNGSGAGGNTGGGNTGSPPPTASFAVDPTARFNVPARISIDTADNLYVMDSGNQVLRKIAPTGDVTTLSGAYSGSADLVTDANGNVLVISGSEIYRISPDGTRSLLRTLPSGPDLPGGRNANGFSIESDGTLHASYQGFRQLMISINQNDEAWGYTYIGGQMLGEHSVASDGQGNLAIAVSPEPEFGKRGIVLIPSSAQTETIRSTEGLPQIEFQHDGYVEDMVYDSVGNLYIADSPVEGQTSSGITISKMVPDRSISTLFSGRPNTSGGSEPGIGIDMGIAVSKIGTVYFTDPSTHSIYKLNASGEAVLVAGKPGEAGNAD